MTRYKRSHISYLGIVTACLLISPAQSQENPRQTDMQQLKRLLDEQSKQLSAQKGLLDEQERKLASQRRMLEEQQRRLEALQSQYESLRAPGATAAPAATAQAPVAPVGRAPEKTEAQATTADVMAIFDQPGVLTPKGSVIFEPSLQYSHSSNTRVALLGFTIIPAITVGIIDIKNVKRDTLIGSFGLRYGVTDRFEVEARLPYVYRSDTTASRPFGTASSTETITDVSGHGIGDLEFAAHYQFNRKGNRLPYLIGNLRVKSKTGKGPFEVPIDPSTNLQQELPTGSGFWGIQPSLTAIYPSDPAVFFGNVSYLWNIKRTIGGFGEVDPGDAIGFNFGMGLAINEKASFSIGYDHNMIFKTKQNGASLANSVNTQVGTLLLGYSYRLDNKRTLNLSLGAGLTEDAPDVQLTVRMPFTL